MKKEYDLKKMKGYRRPGKAKAAPDATVPKTVRMPLDLLAWLEKEGERRGVGYQTAMLLVLREAMLRLETSAHLPAGSIAADMLEIVDAEDRIRAIVRDELKKKAG